MASHVVLFSFSLNIPNLGSPHVTFPEPAMLCLVLPLPLPPFLSLLLLLSSSSSSSSSLFIHSCLFCCLLSLPHSPLFFTVALNFPPISYFFFFHLLSGSFCFHVFSSSASERIISLIKCCDCDTFRSYQLTCSLFRHELPFIMRHHPSISVYSLSLLRHELPLTHTITHSLLFFPVFHNLH